MGNTVLILGLMEYFGVRVLDLHSETCFKANTTSRREKKTNLQEGMG